MPKLLQALNPKFVVTGSKKTGRDLGVAKPWVESRMAPTRV